ncbi:high mobility group protein B2 [Pelomyxa schiedti]|nr:high mobility group protein B2 [Pelomyxa schiedti]
MAEAHPEEDNSGILEAQKRPMPAYFLFAREKRDEVRKSLGPSAQEHAVTLHLARMWKEMSALDKKPFMDLSEQQKKQFLATKKGSKPEPLEEDAEESSEEESPMKPIKRKKAKKDPNHPKRPRSAYMIFAEDRRPGLVATTPGMRPVECMKKLGEMWKSMSPEDKQPFFAKAEADKQRYQKDMEEYNLSLANKPEAAALPEKEVTTTATVPSKRRGGGRHRPASSPSSSDSDNKEKEDAEESSEEESSKKPRRIQKDPNRPKRPMSAYILFVGDRRPGLVAATPGMRPVEYMKKLGEMWKSMSPEDKQPFVAKAEAEKQRYQKDMEEYNLSLANKTEEGATATTCAATVPSKRIGGDPSSSDSDSDTTEKPIRKHIKLDPNQPKRAKTAYMLFCEHRLPQMKESQPTMNVCERIKTIGAEWKALTQQEKQPFVDQAQADKLRYQNDMKAYNASQNP